MPPDLTFFFQVTPSNGLVYPNGQGNYTLKSRFDGLCVDFAKGIDPLNLNMVNCSSLGGHIPWFYDKVWPFGF